MEKSDYFDEQSLREPLDPKTTRFPLIKTQRTNLKKSSNLNSMPFYLRPKNIYAESNLKSKQSPIFTYKNSLSTPRNSESLSIKSEQVYFSNEEFINRNGQNSINESNFEKEISKSSSKLNFIGKEKQNFNNPSIYSITLPYINKAANGQDFSSSSMLMMNKNPTFEIEKSQIFNSNEDISDEINKIIKKYPSIYLRRQAKNKFPKHKAHVFNSQSFTFTKYELKKFKNNFTNNNFENYDKYHQYVNNNYNYLIHQSLNSINYGDVTTNLSQQFY